MTDTLISAALLLLLALVAIGAVEGGKVIRRRWMFWRVRRYQRKQAQAYEASRAYIARRKS